MVIRFLVFSFIVSLLSLALVLFAPFKVPIRGEDKVYSPYWNEIEQLLPKSRAGMTLEESSYFDDLLDKNTRWHEENKKEYLKFSAKDALDSWKKKSSFIAPGIMVLWGVLFYFFYRRKHPSNTALLVLAFPVILTIAQLMSSLELVLIAFAVLAVWFWFLLNPPNATPPESASTQV